MCQVISRRSVIAEARVRDRSRVRPCGMCDGQSDTGTCFSLSHSVFSCQCYSTAALPTHISLGGRTVVPLGPAVQRHYLTHRHE
jgi:hypothetical protein